MKKESTLLFISGIVLGMAAGIFGTRKYYQNKYQKQYEDDYKALEEYYHRTDDYVRVNHDQNNESDEDDPKESDSKPGGRMSAEQRSDIKKKLDKNWKGTTNYAGMYRSKNNEDILEDEEELDDQEENTSPEEEIFEEHQKNKNKPPKIISNEAYSNLPPSVDKDVLYFYAYDEVLCDENEEQVEEERLVGNALTKYGFVDNDERIIFVMNYSLNTCYEIQKVDASWSDLR